jgi:DNA repair photolyase
MFLYCSKPDSTIDIMLQDPPFGFRKGRGALGNPAVRYDRYRNEAFDDGWGGLDAELPPLRTTVARDTSRTVIARNDSPDIGFDRSINPYRGCEHGCIYCYARPSHAYLGLSPGQDFESRLLAKPDAAKLLASELRRPGYHCRPIAMGTNTDPYQPVERRLEITRSILEVLSEHHHPVTIVTKSALVLRDLDILGPMAERRLARVAISVTTLDRTLARRMEPRAATPSRRLEAIRLLNEAGVPCGVMTAPMIPGLNDAELEAILEAAAEAGAPSAAYILVRLPLEVAELFQKWLESHYPDRASRVLSLIRQCREGRVSDATFGQRMRGTGQYAELLKRRFQIACKRLGLNAPCDELDCHQFRLPPRAGDQLSLL